MSTIVVSLVSLVAVVWLDHHHRRTLALHRALNASQGADIARYRTRIWELEQGVASLEEEVRELRQHLGEVAMSRDEVWS